MVSRPAAIAWISRRAAWCASVALALCARAAPGTTATPTQTPFVVCTPPPCATGEVFYCPSDCPGGCGTICATPTPSSTPTPFPGLCLLNIGPGSIDFGDVPIGSSEGVVGARALSIQQAPTATQPITITLSFDPSPPFFDAAGATLRASTTFYLAPHQIDDHPIRCVPTAVGRIRGDITVTATNCPTIDIPLICKGLRTKTPTPTETLTPTDTPTLPVPPCVGDCNGNGVVTVEELITGVRIDLDNSPAAACPAIACHGGGDLIDCLVRAVANALHGCPPTAQSTATSTPTSSPPVSPLPG